MKIAFLSSKSGTTLVELLIAVVIIAMIVLGGGMFFFQGRVYTLREARRRAAVLVASERLEALKAANAYWGDFAPDPSSDPGFDLNLRYYITYDPVDGTWDADQPVVSADDPPDSAREAKTVDNNTQATMVTEAQWLDDDGYGPDDYLRITVTLEWMEGTANNLVALTTLIAER